MRKHSRKTPLTSPLVKWLCCILKLQQNISLSANYFCLIIKFLSLVSLQVQNIQYYIKEKHQIFTSKQRELKYLAFSVWKNNEFIINHLIIAALMAHSCIWWYCRIMLSISGLVARWTVLQKLNYTFQQPHRLSSAMTRDFIFHHRLKAETMVKSRSNWRLSDTIVDWRVTLKPLEEDESILRSSTGPHVFIMNANVLC